MSRSLDSKTVIHPARFAHAVLRTRHLEEAIVFYEKVLGAEIVFRNAMIAFLTYDEEHHRIALAMTPQKETAPQVPRGSITWPTPTKISASFWAPTNG